MTDYDRSLIEGLRRDIRNSKASNESNTKGLFDVVIIGIFTIVLIKAFGKIVAILTGMM